LKAYKKTHFGPENTDFTAEFNKNSDSKKCTEIHHSLREQMSAHKRLETNHKELERMEDLLMMQRAGEVMLEEHEEKNLKEKGRKEVFRRAW
jgi:hypothetical protein